MGLNTHVRTVIELTTCPEHHQHPVLTIADKHITMKCCCIDFEIACYRQMIKLLVEDHDHSQQCGWDRYAPITVPAIG
jgi:hypothetical protein